MDINELKGTMTLTDFAEGITSTGKKNLGELWEANVDCNHCPYREQCQAISDKIQDEYDVNVYYRQVIDYLMGEMSMEDFLKEA